MTAHTQPNPAFPLTTLVQRYPLTLFFALSIGIDWLLSLVAVWNMTLFLPAAPAMSYGPAALVTVPSALVASALVLVTGVNLGQKTGV